MSIGENIKMLRNKKGLTQPKLGDLIHKSESSIRKYESGDVIPSIEIINKLAEIFDVPISHILVNPESDTLIDDLNETFELQDKFEKLGIDTYNTPSTIKLMKDNANLFDPIFDMLKNKFIQKEFNYNYADLWTNEIGDLSAFILEMMELKITEIKYKRLINHTPTDPTTSKK